MDRKGIAGVALAILVLIAWEIYTVKNYRPPVPPPVVAVVPKPSATLSGSSPATASVASTGSAQPAAAVFPEALQKVSTASAEYTFTNRGGALARAVLLKYPADGGAKGGPKVTLNEFGSTAIGIVGRTPGEGGDIAYTVEQSGGQVICQGAWDEQVLVRKRFTIPRGESGKDEYLMKCDISFTNHGAAARLVEGYYFGIGSAAFVHKGDRISYTGFGWFHGEKAQFIDPSYFASKQMPIIGIQTAAEKPAYLETADSIPWAGVTNQYFTTLLSATANPGKFAWARRFPVKQEGSPLYGIEGAMGMPGFKLDAGQTVEQHFDLYCGPKMYGVLKELGNSQEDIMNFNWTKWVSIFLLNAMNWLKSILGNYVAAILVLTICIKSALWIPQNAATKSMKRMQALQPKMTELREKYKDDPTRMNQELMKLYKDYGINPFAGCLPMFIQIPIFFGFFNMLGSAVELRGAGFLWVRDLSQPDTIATIAGYHINLLPLLMAATMLWQMSITPKSGDPVQQRVFMFMPLIFVFFCYNFASALSLYYATQNLFSIGQLYATRNQPLPSLQKVTAGPARKRRGGT